MTTAPPDAVSATATSPTEVAALYAPHYRDGLFFNPWGRFPVRARDVLRWYRGRPWRRPPELPAPRISNDGASLRDNERELAATWVGHATFVLHHQRSLLLTDPHWSARALVPRRHVAPGLPLASVTPCPLVLLSHNHYDHLDAWTVRHLPSETRWLVPLGLEATLRRMGARNVRELDWWQEADDGPFHLTCLPAQHWSNRLGTRRHGTLWCSWLIEVAGRRVYFGGDSGWFAGFGEFGRLFGPLATALLPIGAYEPRWFMRYQHVNPAEALAASQALRARELAGMHWGTFVLTDEPLDEPPRALARAAAAAGVPSSAIRVPAVGERWRIEAP